MLWLPTLIAQASPFFGAISPPPGVAEYNKLTGTASGIGVFIFARYAIQLFMVLCGLYVLGNFLMAGYTFISSGGEAKAYTQAKDQLIASVIGLVMIVSAYTATALVSYIFFGSTSFILNPQIQGPN